MKILLTNDDGINADGLIELNNVLSKYHETYIIAPDRERSACSNIFTIRDEIEVKKIDERTFSISGYPADCVSIALHSDIVPDVDLVISGINHGPNLGDDVHFSGTVAGARTAYIFGKPAIAFSINSFHKPSDFFVEASEFINNFINNHKFENNFFYNINYPDISSDKICGIKYTHLSKRYYRDSYHKKVLENGEGFGVTLQGEIETEKSAGSDSAEMERGFISVTPLAIDSTDYTLLKAMQS